MEPSNGVAVLAALDEAHAPDGVRLDGLDTLGPGLISDGARGRQC